MTETRKHVDTILIESKDWPEPDAVIISTFGGRIGLALLATGHGEIWLTLEEAQEIVVSLEGAVVRAEKTGEDGFSEIYLQQEDDFGAIVPAFALVSNHRGEIGLYISVKDGDGAQVWMPPSHCKRIMAALQAAGE